MGPVGMPTMTAPAKALPTSKPGLRTFQMASSAFDYSRNATSTPFPDRASLASAATRPRKVSFQFIRLPVPHTAANGRCSGQIGAGPETDEDRRPPPI